MTREYDKGLTCEQSIVETLQRITFLTTKDLALLLGKKRKRTSDILWSLVKQGRVVRVGSPNKARYALPGQRQSQTKDFVPPRDIATVEEWRIAALWRVMQEVGIVFEGPH